MKKFTILMILSAIAAAIVWSQVPSETKVEAKPASEPTTSFFSKRGPTSISPNAASWSADSKGGSWKADAGHC